MPYVVFQISVPIYLPRFKCSTSIWCLQKLNATFCIILSNLANCPPTPSSPEFRFKATSSIPTCSTFALGNKSSKSCPTWTPSSTSCISVCVEILFAVARSSSESSRGPGPFQTLNSGCLPFEMWVARINLWQPLNLPIELIAHYT